MGCKKEARNYNACYVSISVRCKQSWGLIGRPDVLFTTQGIISGLVCYILGFRICLIRIKLGSSPMVLSICCFGLLLHPTGASVRGLCFSMKPWTSKPKMGHKARCVESLQPLYYSSNTHIHQST